MLRTATSLLIGLLLLPAAAADELPAALSAEQSVVRVIAAVEAQDADTLKALAARARPDPWRVADELCARDKHDAAAAFAAAAADLRQVNAGLPAYVESRRGKEDDAAAREALEFATARIRARDNEGAYEALEDHEGDGHTVTGIAILFHKGLIFRPMRRLEESSALSLRAASAAERWGWVEMAIRAYDSAGIVHRVLKNTKESIRYYQKALRHAEALGNIEQLAQSALNLAYVQHETWDYASALQGYLRTVTLFEKLGDESQLAGVLNNIGRIQTTLGDYGQALAHHHRALELNRKFEKLASAAGDQVNIGIVHSDMGAWAKALEFYEGALRDAETAGKTRTVFNALNNIASVYWDLGDPIQARAYAERALALMKAEGHEVDAGPVVIGLGMIHARWGDLERAWTYYEKGLALARTHGQRQVVANALGNMGRLHLQSGQNAQALGRYNEAFDICEELGDRALAARYSAAMGMTAIRMGEREAGIERVRDAIREARRLRAAPLLAWALPQLARQYLADGDASRALYLTLEGLRVVESQLGGLGEERSASVRSTNMSLFSVGALAAMRTGEPAEVVTFLESGRAGSLLEALGGRSAMRWSDLSLELRQAELDAKRDHDAAQAAYQHAVATAGLPERRTASKALAAAGLRVSEVDARIRREAKGQTAGLFYPRAATVDELQRSLDKSQAMVLYGLCEGEALAVVLTPQSESLIPLGKAADLTAACEALSIPDAEADAEGALATLRDLLVKPLSLPDSVTQVVVSPEASLCYLPFGALYGIPVALTPSGTTHAMLMKEAPISGNDVLALGDPVYGDGERPENKVYARGQPLRALPFTRAEAKAVGDMVLLGKEATEAGLREALTKHERWRAVHFACHGLVDSETPSRSSLALSRAEGEDGFLTAREVVGMAIPTDLAVLSACETGKGQVVRGEGILGLTRAFMYAGAPRVLCSLWKVDDEATSALMVKFYELWNPDPKGLSALGKGKPRGAAEALRQAQAHVRAQPKWKHPYYWAAWVLWGLPR